METDVKQEPRSNNMATFGKVKINYPASFSKMKVEGQKSMQDIESLCSKMSPQAPFGEDEHETSTTNEPSAGSETNPQEQTASGGDDPTPASANADQDESEENMKTDVKQEPRSDNMPELDDDSEQKPSKDATSASTSNVKNEPKDPLAQAMDELTGGGGKNDDDADKSNDDMDGASALAALASAAASTAENSSENGKSTKEKSSSSNGTSSSKDPQEAKRDANWFDVGIIKGSSCTVSSYYLPSGDGERPEIDVEGMHIYTVIWFSIYLLLFI